MHHLLLSGTTHQLGSYYPSVAGESARPIDDGLYPAFADFVAANRDPILALIRTRTTQTNDARRSVLVLPLLGLVAEATGQPLALLELGASAGLNLLLDRYRFAYGPFQVGDPGATVRVSCELRGPLVPSLPALPPSIAWRRGVDLNPLDVRDAESVAWLRALLWPEHGDRIAVLDAAVAMARREPPTLVRGDLVELLPTLAAEAPDGAALVVLHSWVLAYLTTERRLAMLTAVRKAARRLDRSIWLASCEGARVLASLALGLDDAGPDGEGASGLALSRFDPDGSSAHRLLARCHAHGRWLQWLESASAMPA